jgi:predicted nuclease of predicted toxin-antitoxin system
VRWLLDEMLPPACVAELRSRGHDAISVLDVGMAGAPDAEVFERAVREARVVVTENFADFARLVAQALACEEPCVAVVLVRRDSLPKRGALAVHLVRQLDAWASANPEPYVGLHWP